jgi:hypothetical protein
MAKTPSKTSAKTAAKKVTAAAKAPKSKPSVLSIEKVSVDTWKKLAELGLDHQLQADLEWCLGSYKADNNPTGLYEMAERSLKVFVVEKEKKTKGITAKVISDLEKVIKSR